MNLKRLSLRKLRALYWMPDTPLPEKEGVLAELAIRKAAPPCEDTKAKHKKPPPKPGLVSKIYKRKEKLLGRPLSGGRVG